VAIAAAVARVDANRSSAASLGAAGREVALAISWDTVIERLLSHG
jgi:glycosyltransferase involved in cell wall biosynthesis